MRLRTRSWIVALAVAGTAQSQAAIMHVDASRAMPFIIISTAVHENVDGVPYSNAIQYSHSSFLRTMQKIFEVDPPHGYPWLGAAANATDLSDLLAPGTLMNLRSLPLP